MIFIKNCSKQEKKKEKKFIKKKKHNYIMTIIMVITLYETNRSGNEIIINQFYSESNSKFFNRILVSGLFFSRINIKSAYLL
ncbi:hypothetical protein LCGC14_1176960 [marine sediment metagenome]|uniref:Uncharacterized protein n=1 Tax=marine sediment metagenome TaxID=412755 RepID=A0A0F9P679_9ZZZZ